MITHFSASAASTMAGWISAAILKGFSGVLTVREMTLEPQQNCRPRHQVSIGSIPRAKCS